MTIELDKRIFYWILNAILVRSLREEGGTRRGVRMRSDGGDLVISSRVRRRRHETPRIGGAHSRDTSLVLIGNTMQKLPERPIIDIKLPRE